MSDRGIGLTVGCFVGFDSPTVWSEFTPLSQKHQSVNLGQGFPDWETPQFAKDALIEAINANHNQYSRSAGDPALVGSIAEHYGPLIGRQINPLTEVAVCVGASEALFAVMQSMVNEGDEVVVLEPTFDIYTASIQMAGGVVKAVPLELNRSTGKWELDLAKYERAITPKTRLLLLNTPHNPTGKVFSRAELSRIVELLQKYPHVTAVTDEVYEKLVYDGHEHIRLASLPGMWERTLTISSSGKTFSATGWKIGWCYGAEHLVKPIILANQWIQYCVSTPTQKAIAKILKQAESPYQGYPSYYEYIRLQYLQKRNHLVNSLRDGGFEPAVPEGGFFIMADTSKYDPPAEYLAQPGLDGKPVSRDWAFARWLTIEKGITPIPPSAFYTEETKGNAAYLARFAFCKTDDLLEEAKRRFHKLTHH